MKLTTATALALAAAALAGCTTAQLQEFNRNLAAANEDMARSSGQPARPSPMAQPLAGGQKEQIQLVVPNDPKEQAAVDAALPTIKKVLAIHQCAKSDDALLALNALAISGVNIAAKSYGWAYPINRAYFKYHDFSKCLSIRSIDQFTMPALNAINFRIVYFAEDSGETTNFYFLFKKTDDGVWRLADRPSTNNNF